MMRKDNEVQKKASKERITNTDHFDEQKPIRNRAHLRHYLLLYIGYHRNHPNRVKNIKAADKMTSRCEEMQHEGRSGMQCIKFQKFVSRRFIFRA